MISGSNQHDVAVSHRHGPIGAAIVQALHTIRVRVLEAVIVNFFELHFAGRPIDVVLVRRITRPVARRRKDFADEQPIGREPGWDDIDNLARGVAAAANFEAAVFGPDDACLELRTRRPARRSFSEGGLTISGAAE